VVARDSSRSVIKAWANQLVAKDPARAEASAIMWALTQAKQEPFLKVIMKSDAKVCIDTLLGDPDEANWNISTLCTDIHH
jgi:ribonuclease HI